MLDSVEARFLIDTPCSSGETFITLQITANDCQSLRYALVPAFRRLNINFQSLGIVDSSLGYRRLQDVQIYELFDLLSQTKIDENRFILTDKVAFKVDKNWCTIPFTEFYTDKTPYEILQNRLQNLFEENMQPYLNSVKVCPRMGTTFFLSLISKHCLEFRPTVFIVPPAQWDVQWYQCLSQYTTTGQMIAKDNKDYVEHLVERIKFSAGSRDFYFITGPSWSGKTQLVYVFDYLSKLSLNPFKALDPPFYCALHLSLSDPTRSINLITEHVSKELIMAIDRDVSNIDAVLANNALQTHVSSRFETFLMTMGISSDEFAEIKEKSKLIEFFKTRIDNETRKSLQFIQYFSYIYSWTTLGLLKPVLSQWKASGSYFVSNELEYYPCKLFDFNEFIATVSESRPVIICLDEFNDGERLNLSMLRTLLQQSNCVPVLISSNAKITNFGGVAWPKLIQTRGETKLYCSLVFKFPKISTAHMDSLFQSNDVSVEISNWLKLSRNRPGIFLKFMEAKLNYREHSYSQLLMDAASATFEGLIREKPKLANSNSILGFFSMLFPSFRSKATSHNQSIELIDQHLAHLLPIKESCYSDLPDILPLFRNSFNILKTFHNGKHHEYNGEACSTYLDLKDDELTQFVFFTGWKEINTPQNLKKRLIDLLMETKLFEQSGKVSKKDIFATISQCDFIDPFSIPFRTAVEFIALSKVGKEAEPGEKLVYIVHGSFVKASASMGPSGSTAEAFLPKFVGELQLINKVTPTWESKSLDILGPIKNQIVPYAMAVDYRISREFRNIPGTYTGTLVPTPNKHLLDGFFTPDWKINWIDDIDHIKDKLGNASDEDLLLTRCKSDFDEVYKENDLHQLYFTFETKNMFKAVGASVLNEILVHCIVDGRSFQRRYAPKNHIHLVVASSFSDFTKATIADLKKRFGCACRLLKMTFNEETGEIGFMDLFDISEDPIIVEKPAASKGQKGRKQPKEIEKFIARPLPKDEVKSTVILIDVEKITGYDLASPIEFAVKAMGKLAI